VTETAVFANFNVSKEDVLSQLFIGVSSAPAGSTTSNLGNGVTVHMMGGIVDETSVFQVIDNKGRNMYLKNMLSTVSLEGWIMPPQILEAEDATINNAVSSANVIYASVLPLFLI